MTTSRPALVLWLVPAVYFLFVAAEFAALTHLSLSATADGRSAAAVGAIATSLWLGILLSSLRAQHLVARFGHARVFAAATALAVVALGLLPLHASFSGGLASVFVLGLAGGLVWVAGEAWLAETAPAARRGFFVGLFETAVGLGLMAGPALVPLTRWLEWPTLWVSVALMLPALAASLWLLTAQAMPERVSGQPGDAAAATPVRWRHIALPLAGIAALSGLMESGVSSLMPSIAMRMSFSFEAAAWLGAVIGAGSALLQTPIGHVADRWGVRRTTLLAWAIVLAANLSLVAAAAAPDRLLWIVGFVLGGVGGAVYTLIIVELGHRLTGTGLVKAIALLVIAYSVGTTIGPLLGGALFDAAGLPGLAVALAVLSALGLAATARGLRSG